MKIREKEIIDSIITDLKSLQETVSKDEIIRYLDYIIILRKRLGHTDEFMEKLYFIRNYYNLGGVFND